MIQITINEQVKVNCMTTSSTQSALDDNIIYKIVGVKQNSSTGYQNLIQIQLSNSSRSFCCLLEDIYTKDWLKYFSKEDCTYLATLYVAETKNLPEVIQRYPRSHTTITPSVLALAIIYTSFLILANIAGSKIVDLGFLTVPAVLGFFPFTYILDDIITEVYGFKVSRNIILCALLANLIVVLGSVLVVKLQPSEYWGAQKAFEEVFLSSPRILAASVVAYLCGEFFNAIILSKMKTYTNGKYLWLRSLVSTSAGALLDSVLFCIIAFALTLPSNVIFAMILSQYLCKIIYAILALPVVYKVTKYLKNIDNIDVYDFGTKYNPFSIK